MLIMSLLKIPHPVGWSVSAYYHSSVEKCCEKQKALKSAAMLKMFLCYRMKLSIYNLQTHAAVCEAIFPLLPFNTLSEQIKIRNILCLWCIGVRVFIECQIHTHVKFCGGL